MKREYFDWYESYGDVVLFDKTYKVNAYDMPCGILVGVNNHGKTILFGCALSAMRPYEGMFQKYC